MILSSEYTGHGHASIAKALTAHLDTHSDVRYQVVDAFSLNGKPGILISKAYGPITRHSPGSYRLLYSLSNRHPARQNRFSAALIRRRFLKVIAEFRPDLILNLHPLFCGSVLNILESRKIDIPVITLLADMANMHSCWFDVRNRLTLCPTSEALAQGLRMGLPEEKLRLVGFPVNRNFTEAARRAAPRAYEEGKPLRCLLMSGAECSGKLERYALQLLEHVDCRVTVICGRNERMLHRFTRNLVPRYGDRIRVLGFQNNIWEHMMDTDILIARASPNTMMEAVVMNVPLIITGALPGQEAENPALVRDHNLGVVCTDPDTIPSIIEQLVRDHGRGLEEIRESQRVYRDLDAAEKIVSLVLEACSESAADAGKGR